ncbi:MAG: hypothetical protein A2054_06110 [Deltaproteobacteria bacterium GWA2_55_10]|nr:MAG: hypothetical protein A2054_06110 [Deltaproteobacteria bacterium GWA2_55_10]
MKLRDHVITGTVGAAVLYPLLGTGSLAFWLASIFIDIDHYLDFLWNNRFTDFSVRSMFAYHDWLYKKLHRPEFLNIELFHTAEFLGPLLLIALWTDSGLLLSLWLGCIFHCMLDAVNLAVNRAPFVRAHSFTEYFIRRRLLAKKGLRPADLYQEAVRMTREA